MFLIFYVFMFMFIIFYIFWKTAILFEKLEYFFLVHSTLNKEKNTKMTSLKLILNHYKQGI